MNLLRLLCNTAVLLGCVALVWDLEVGEKNELDCGPSPDLLRHFWQACVISSQQLMQLDYMGLNGDTRKGKNTYDIERNKTVTMSCLVDFAFSMQTKDSLNQYVRIQ